jgi:Tfp pilus assembly protein PilO
LTVADVNEQNKKILRFVVAGGVVACGLFGWLGWCDWDERNVTLEKSRSAQELLDRTEMQIREIPKLEERVILLRETVKECVRILPDEREINSFVDQLTQFTSKAGVRVSKLDDEDLKARNGRNKKGATAAFDRVVYKVSLEGTCEQLLRFMDLFENHERFVRIGSLKIEHRSTSLQNVDPLTVPHQIDLDLETYVYNAKVKSKDTIEIPQEPAKLEKLRAAGHVESENILTVAEYHHDPSDRRDLFYDPRMVGAAKLKATAAEREAKEKVLTDLAERIRKIAKDATAEAAITNAVRKAQAREKVTKDLVAIGVEISHEKEQPIFATGMLKDRFKKEVDVPFQKLMEGRDAPTVSAVALQQVEDHVNRMDAALGERRYDDVVTLYREVSTMKAAAKDQAACKVLFERADGIHRIARTNLDFNAVPLRFGGCVCYRDDPAHAVVIINDMPYSPGDAINGEIIVRRISPGEVTFEYRGLTLTQAIKVSAPRPAVTGPGKKKKS